VLLDYQLKGDDGLAICHRLKRGLLPPRVVVYSAYADGALAIPAAVAGADGVVSKDTPVTELFEAIRRIVNGETVWPPMTAEARRLPLSGWTPRTCRCSPCSSAATHRQT